ncbi:MAG: alcohol dehydrogenase family protein [Rhodospirillales bacterium]
MAIPRQMKGMVLTAHGGPECLQWREDLPVPAPRAGEVLVRVGAASVNNTDINTRIGWYSKSVRNATSTGASDGVSEGGPQESAWSGATIAFPRIQGADCCGRIVAVGDDVPGKRIGERVLVRALQIADSADGAPATVTLGSELDGAFAEYARVRNGDAIAIRSSLTDLELASFPCAFSTAEGMIQRAGIDGGHVLVTGASGGVGSAAIQLAKRRGAHVTAVSTAAKAAMLMEIGADRVLDRDDPLPQKSFDTVIDLVGGPAWPRLLESIRIGGAYAVAGAIAGPIVELDLRTLYLRDLSLLGCTHQPARIFTDLVGYIERGEIRPVIAQSFALADMHAAQEAFLAKRHIGKIGIEVASGGA